ncbi:MAG: hypothetical protein JNN24_12975 [Hyphomicrobium zavarzinii]|uniref:hypothetical protein n=1 Tax=Hyphomicrobium TaxID=81 RepID=UPI00036A824B|nr:MULTISPECIES: hypothetical protein [Hyphomicrobium]MBL8846675.1 hypothetical protein [Hyphomicrobium zavarzinii]WBT39913.1 hypothetical protein PE058_08520 [Hyphomicrobium sp. DMF-1]HML43267.1 hypothetical protein [Hyphomicrobium zavarzinii]
MKLKSSQLCELIGIAILLASAAAQLFYLEPLKREIEWRLATFSTQQSAQVQTSAMFENHLSVLALMNAPPEQVKKAEARRDEILGQFKTADANISDFMIEKERVESYIEVIVIALFAFGSLLAGIGRMIEMQARPD